MSAEEFAIGVNPDGGLLAVLVDDSIVTLFALAGLLLDPKDLVVAGFFFNGVLRCGWKVLHLDRGLFNRLRRHAKGEAGADHYCWN